MNFFILNGLFHLIQVCWDFPCSRLLSNKNNKEIIISAEILWGA
ncbi:MAG: hypothetical protein OP8BY_2408 [Candidatus Saccharicenans subterraneus]|uniref:Uncharacterized protein n=1 Tax=Candidatus Saccharicenans subterraneus TaxID=2508984 RepID=A0A3E2BJ26_9BACT|nr:MAG: hypothetical protein OP8BY_2408 [Candidatus Saccharicenans subterraneum]